LAKEVSHPSVYLAIPAHTDIHPLVLEAIMLMVANKDSYIDHVHVDSDKYKRIDVKRNEMAERFLQSDCTHILWCDSDTVTMTGAVKQLLEHDVPVIGAIVYKKGGNYTPTFGYWVPEKFIYSTPIPFKYNERLEVDIVGFGFTLIMREVFENLKRPWFKCLGATMGKEDIYFCVQARNAGMEIYVDTGLHLGHISDHYVITNLDYERQTLWNVVEKFKEQGRFGDFQKALHEMMYVEPEELMALSQDDPLRRLAYIDARRRITGPNEPPLFIKKAYIDYIGNVSGRAISWELAEYLHKLMPELRAKRVLDMGTGFTSYFFRQYPVEEIWSVDHDPFWLEVTQKFVNKHKTDAPNRTIDEYVLLDDFKFEGKYDIITIDTGPTEMDRVKLFGPAKKHCSGVIIVDDTNDVEFGMATKEFFKNDLIFDLSETVKDGIGRFAWMIVPKSE